MDFGWSQEQESLYDNTLSFARDRLNQLLAEGSWGKEVWRECGELGLTGLCVDERYGGMGFDALTTARLIEALGFGCRDMGLVFAISAHLFASLKPLEEHGSEELKQRFLPDLCSGAKLAANGITEAEAGSDPAAIKTTARRDGDSYILQGEKSYVSGGPLADVFLVYASTNPGFGYMGISAFLIPADTPGIKAGNAFAKIGLQTARTSTLYLEECRVPASQMVGEEGKGLDIFNRSMFWERTCLFAGYLGAMQRQLDEVVAHAKTRRQFRKPIGSFQAISHKIADMKLRLEGARWQLYRACWSIDRGEPGVIESSLAKLAISEAAVQSGLDAIQIFGGMGVMSETGIANHLLDALPSRIFSGTSEMQRNIIARELGL